MDAKTAAKESTGTQAFTIPNTPEGLAFRDQLKKYLNRNRYGIHCRGRGKRPSRQYHASLPQEMSDWLAIYIQPNKAEKERILKIKKENYKNNEYRKEADKNLIAQYIKVIKALRQQLTTLQLAKNKIEHPPAIEENFPTATTPLIVRKMASVKTPLQNPTIQKVSSEVITIEFGGKTIQIEGAKSIKIVD